MTTLAPAATQALDPIDFEIFAHRLWAIGAVVVLIYTTLGGMWSVARGMTSAGRMLISCSSVSQASV